MEAFFTLKKLGVNRILTSGQKVSTIEGVEMIKQLIAEAGDDLIILPGRGLNVANIGKFASFTMAKEYHATCRSIVESKMEYRNHEVTMGGLP